MKIDFTEWTLLESEGDLVYHYPKHVYGTYRPQPWLEPHSYPCFFKEVAIIDNSNGPDHAVLAYLYPEE